MEAFPAFFRYACSPCSCSRVPLTHFVLVELTALSCFLRFRIAEDLLKDISNMLSDFSTELDSMFE